MFNPKTLRLIPIAAGLALAALGAQAQTVLKIGYTVPKESHYGVGAQDVADFAARYPACTCPCPRFTDALAGDCAGLGVRVCSLPWGLRVRAGYHRTIFAIASSERKRCVRSCEADSEKGAGEVGDRKSVV